MSKVDLALPFLDLLFNDLGAYHLYGLIAPFFKVVIKTYDCPPKLLHGPRLISQSKHFRELSGLYIELFFSTIDELNLVFSILHLVDQIKEFVLIGVDVVLIPYDLYSIWILLVFVRCQLLSPEHHVLQIKLISRTLTQIQFCSCDKANILETIKRVEQVQHQFLLFFAHHLDPLLNVALLLQQLFVFRLDLSIQSLGKAIQLRGFLK